MARFEYKIATVPNGDELDYIDALNLLGEDGWELVHEEMCVDVEESVCTFKRQRSELNPSEAFSDN